MRSPEDFLEFRRKVDMMLDNALSHEDEKEIMNHVRANPEYGRFLENEKNFRHFVKENVVRPKVSSDFIESIRQKVRII